MKIINSRIRDLWMLLIYQLKSLSQIHCFHFSLGYDALTACFMVISMSGCALPLLPQYCSSSFFHATGLPFKASASFNFSLQFSECRRWAVQKYASQSSRTVAVRHLNWHCSAIFRLQYGLFPYSVVLIDCVRLQGARRRTGVPPTFHLKVAGSLDVLPNGGPWGLLQCTNCKKCVSNRDFRDHFQADIYNCSETMHFQLHHLIYDVSPKFYTFQNIGNV
jgi:hypothetical protein